MESEMKRSALMVGPVHFGDFHPRMRGQSFENAIENRANLAAVSRNGRDPQGTPRGVRTTCQFGDGHVEMPMDLAEDRPDNMPL